MKKIVILLYALLFYFIVSSVVYRFHHPELTETQLFLDFFKIITWQ